MESHGFIEVACEDPQRPPILNRLERARQLLSQEPALARSDIFCAAIVGHANTVAPMLAESLSLAKREGGPRNWTPLLYLCFSVFHGDGPKRRGLLARVARLLLDAGADPNVGVKHQERRTSALHAATAQNHTELVELLLEAGAVDRDSQALLCAAQLRDNGCLRLLLRDLRGTERQTAYRGLLQKVRMNDLEGVELFLEHGFDPNCPLEEFDGTALHVAIEHESGAELIELLLKRGVSINAVRRSGKTAWAMAMRIGASDPAEQLRLAGAEGTLTPGDRLLAACSSGDRRGANEIFERHRGLLANPTQEDIALIRRLIDKRNTAGLRIALSCGLNPDLLLTADRTSLLHHGARTGYLDLVELLLDFKPLIDPVDNRGRTPLGMAVHGAVHSPDTSGRDFSGAIRRLLEAGADPDEHRSGWPLRIATYHNNLPVIHALLDGGAAPGLPSRNGETALSIAKQQNRWDLVQLLDGPKPE